MQINKHDCKYARITQKYNFSSWQNVKKSP